MKIGHDLSFRTSVVGKPDLPVSPLKGDLEQLPDLNTDEIVEHIVSDSDGQACSARGRCCRCALEREEDLLKGSIHELENAAAKQ